MTLASGSKLRPYEIVAPLCAGGTGEVYRARDTRLERTVAIKILPRELSNDSIRKQRFEREASKSAPRLRCFRRTSCSRFPRKTSSPTM
jgi:serine/threonine protein kinase